MKAGVSAAGYKPLPQESEAEASSPPPPLTQQSTKQFYPLREEGGAFRIDDSDDEETEDLDLQNRHSRPRAGSSHYSPQTPTIYEEESRFDKPYRENMSVNAYEVGSDSDSVYGGGMRGVASDYAYGSGAGVGTGTSGLAKEGRKGDRTALYVALVRSILVFIDHLI